MRPTAALDDNLIDITALLHRDTIFNHPRDVLQRPSLSVLEKRAILGSWASDASAVPSCPALRGPAGLRAPVTSARSSKPCVNRMGDLPIRRAASPIASVRTIEPWPLSITLPIGAAAN
jgi:hypothetical protein